jgi:hypothetical protein
MKAIGISRSGFISRADPTLLAAGCLQLAATLTPAARVKIVGPVSFVRLPTAGAGLVGLAMLTLTLALLPRGWWRWVPSVLSGMLVTILYWRLRHAPSGTFLDPLLRHTLHPAWGFVPMSAAVLLGLAGAARGHASRHGQPFNVVTLDAVAMNPGGGAGIPELPDGGSAR